MNDQREQTQTLRQEKSSYRGFPGFSPAWQHAIVTFVTLAYAITFPLAYRQIGSTWSAMVILPVAVAAFIFGLYGGMLAGLFGIFLNAILFYLVGENGIELILSGGLPGASLIMMLGAAIGWLSSLLAKVRKQSHELEIAHEQALEASRAKSELLSKVSHDLRTPLGAILGYAELMQLGTYGQTTEKQDEKLEQIIENTQELSIFVNDLLDLSRAESGRMKLNLNPVELRALVEETRTRMSPAAKSKGLQLTFSIDPDLPDHIQNDEIRLSQILMNLIDNAIKYTESGKIEVAFLSHQNTSQWALQVRDTGAGIPEEAHKVVFEAFRQGDDSTSTAREGVGLGLSIVQDLVDLMGGEIELESQVGQGSIFTVILPVDISEEATR